MNTGFVKRYFQYINIRVVVYYSAQIHALQPEFRFNPYLLYISAPKYSKSFEKYAYYSPIGILLLDKRQKKSIIKIVKNKSPMKRR